MNTNILLLINELYKKEVLHQTQIDDANRCRNGQPMLKGGMEMMRLAKIMGKEYEDIAIEYLKGIKYYEGTLYDYV